MTREEVIQRAQEINERFEPSLSDILTPFTYAIGVITLLILIGMTWDSKERKFTFKKKGHSIFVCVAITCIIACTGSIVNSVMSEHERESKAIPEWKSDYAYKYIDALTPTKVPIRSATSTISKSDKFWKTSLDTPLRTDTYPDSRILLSVTYIDEDKNVLKKIERFAIREDSEVEDPYMTYQTLDKGLTNGVDKGDYNKIVYIPQGYDLEKGGL